MNVLRSYAQLVRLPNLPTAMADITLAALATGSLPGRWSTFLLLLLASSCSYLAGMVLNDVFDIDKDRKERPDRPLPSGRITLRQAAWLGAMLLLAGLLAAVAAGFTHPNPGARLVTPIVAFLLACAILLYDGWLKRTVLGPIAMGSCRFLNVLLGVTISGSLLWPLGPHLALVVGVYIIGVTWFARTEAQTSNQTALAGAAAVMLTGLLLALPLPVHQTPDNASPAFVYLLVALGFFLGFPIHRAIVAPSPANVQAAVKRSLLGLILLDTVLATATAGTIGLVLLVLLLPGVYLQRRRWLYST